MVCVVGALAVDLLIHRDHFRRGTSNPAAIRISAGGVGYRIYAPLGHPKMLFTALGSDLFGRWLMSSVQEPRSVNAIFLDRYPTSLYCALMQSGELLYGASDMAVIEKGLTWQRLQACLPDLGKRDFLVLEANLGPGLVRSLVRHGGARTRVVFESVSVEKLLRHAGSLKDLFLLAGNEEEIRALGRWYQAQESPEAGGRAASGESRSGRWVREFLERRRIQQLLVTRGRRGARLYRRDPGGPPAGVTGGGSRGALEVPPTHVLDAADTTGAGDRLLGAYLEALDREVEPGNALRQAMSTVERGLRAGSL